MFVYDTALGLWHKEDSTHASGFATHEGELFYVDAATKKIMSVGGRLSVHAGGVQYDAVNGAAEGDVAWYAESGDIGLDLPDNKYISRLLLRVEVDASLNLTIGLKYDGAGDWDEFVIPVTTPLRTVKLPVYTQRCDHLRLKISGTGACKIFSLTKTVEVGAE
jgi:hypothetical protein